MKTLYTILLIAILTATCFGQGKTVEMIKSQAKPFKMDKRYIAEYDKFEDESSVYFIGFDFFGVATSFLSALSRRNTTPPSLLMGAGFSFPTNELKETPKEMGLYVRWSGDEFQFIRESKLIFLIDDERITLDEGKVQSRIKYGGVRETIGFMVSPELLKKIGNGKSVEFKIGQLEMKLKPEHQQMFLNILKLADVNDLPPPEKKKK